LYRVECAETVGALHVQDNSLAATQCKDVVRLIHTFHDRLGHVNPFPEHDILGGHIACVCHAVQHIDERLHAENDFLDSCDALDVLARLCQLADNQHETMLAAAANSLSSATHPCSIASTSSSESAAEPPSKAALEALMILRFLRTRQCKLQTLHYLNAVVAVQVEVLSDEDAELGLLDVESVPRSGLADPVALHANQTPHVDSLASAKGEDPKNGAKSSSAETHSLGNGIRYRWEDDPVCAVCVRDGSGQRTLHAKAMELFEVFERETLRIATFFLEKWWSAAEGNPRSDANKDIDILQVCSIEPGLWMMQPVLDFLSVVVVPIIPQSCGD
jgi:hypothetical protein